MQIGHVVGHVTATIKHPSLTGWKLLIVQMLGVDDRPDGEPQLAIDSLGAGAGARVMVTSDGAEVRKLVGSKTSPVRWMVLGLCE